MSNSRKVLVLAGCFSLIPLLNFPLALVTDRTLFIRDIAMGWASQVEAVVQQVGRGELPFFDAHRAFGQPLFADPRAQVLYPPAWIHLLLPPEKSYSWFAAIHLVVAALGAARLAARLVPNISMLAQTASGLVYGASGPLLSLVAHWHHLAAAAWMPWILEQAGPDPDRPIRWPILSVLIALQALAGSPDYLFCTLTLCALRWLTASGPRPRPTGLVLSVLLGLGLSAVQLLPSLSFAQQAARDPRPVGWAIAPMHPALSIEAILPIRVSAWPLRPEARDLLIGGSQVWMFSHYLGLSAWALALFGFTRASAANRRFGGGAVVLGFVFSWGITNPRLQEVVAQVPLIAGLRFPTKHLAAAGLGLSILAACGVMAGSQVGPGKRAFGAALAGIVALGGGLFQWATIPGAPRETWTLGLCLVAMVAFLGILVAKKTMTVPWQIPIWVAIDLLGAHSRLNPTAPASLFRDRPPLTAFIPKSSRLYVSDYSIALPRSTIRLPGSTAYQMAKVPQGFEPAASLTLAALWYLNPPSAGRLGYFGSFDLDILDFYRAPLKRSIEKFVTSRDAPFVVGSLRRASVDYVVTMDPPDLWATLPLVVEEQRFFEATVRVHRVPDPWPRTRFETPQGELLKASVNVLEMSDGRIRVEGSTSVPARLVFAVANDPGWRARVDGVETPVADTDQAFVSIPVGAGRHVFDLRYVPPGIELGVSISVLSVFALLASLTLKRRAPGNSTSLKSARPQS